MPAYDDDEPTLTGWKRRISEYCEEHGIEKSQSAIRRIAVRIDKRARSYWDVDLSAYVLNYQDPTGETAVNNVLIERSF